AADIARRMITNAKDWGSPAPDTAIVATGQHFADALAVSSPAGANNMPIVLVEPRSIPPETHDLIMEGRLKNVIIVGGPGAVHPDVEEGLRSRGVNVLGRLWGSDQYETSVSIASHGDAFFKFTRPGAVFVSRGDHYVDGVAAGALAARLNPAPILLVEPSALPEPVRTYVAENKDFIDQIYIVGGPGAVSRIVADALGLAM
ncbi:MAG: cell wall-binding repeat-containing protein, partial [Terriglobia bacterium]